MPYILSNNAYHVLGLDVSAGRKEIARRAKEIQHRLRAEDEPSYPLDLNIFEGYRDEAAVKRAEQALSNPKRRISEYFFWFLIADDVDERAAESLAKQDYESAISIWQEHAEAQGARAWFYRKNLAILYTLLLFKEDNTDYRRLSLQLWKEMLESEKFWSAFVKAYQLDDDLGVSDELIDTFRRSASKQLADVYGELSEKYNNQDYIADFSDEFAVKGEHVEKKVLGPIYQKLQAAVETLEGLKASEDGKLDADEAKTIKEAIGQIQAEANRLIDVGLYDDSQSKTIRDRAAKAIRTVVLDLYNNLNETEKAVGLMNVALTISGTAGIKSRIEADIKTLEQNRQGEKTIEPVTRLLEAEKYEEALQLTEQLLVKHKDDRTVVKALNDYKKLCVSVLAVRKYQQGHSYMDAQQEDLAKPLFDEAGRLIYENIDLFNIEKSAVDKLIGNIKEQLAQTTIKNVGQLDDIRNEIQKVAKENFEGQLEERVLVILVDSYIYWGAVDLVKKMRHKAKVANALSVLGWITVWFYGIGLVFFVASWIYRNYDSEA